MGGHFRCHGPKQRDNGVMLKLRLRPPILISFRRQCAVEVLLKMSLTINSALSTTLPFAIGSRVLLRLFKSNFGLGKRQTVHKFSWKNSRFPIFFLLVFQNTTLDLSRFGQTVTKFTGLLIVVVSFSYVYLYLATLYNISHRFGLALRYW